MGVSGGPFRPVPCPGAGKADRNNPDGEEDESNAHKGDG